MKKEYKDFTVWNALKTHLHNRKFEAPNYKEGDIWWCSIGVNIGFEEDGKGLLLARPVLVVKGFSQKLVWIVPLSTTSRRGKYYLSFEYKNKKSVALLSQLRTIDTRRFGKHCGRIDGEMLKRIKRCLVDLLTE